MQNVKWSYEILFRGYVANTYASQFYYLKHAQASLFEV